jgi:hypothetical protein
MRTPRPWTAEIKDWEGIHAELSNHDNQISRQLIHYAQHLQAFDATFYDGEPILEITLDKNWARDFLLSSALGDAAQLARLLDGVTFSDGTSVRFGNIWTLNYMPPDIDIRGVDLARGEDVAGFGGETIRQIIHETYKCQSRAEEDFFLARWIAS